MTRPVPCPKIGCDPLFTGANCLDCPATAVDLEDRVRLAINGAIAGKQTIAERVDAATAAVMPFITGELR